MVSKFILLSLGSLSLLIGMITFAGTPRQLPPRPDYYVLDEAHILDGRSIHAIESLLTEHDRLTNEQAIIAIFKNAGHISPQSPNSEKEWTHRLFVEWKIGKRHHDEGILLTIFLDTGHAFLKIGYGLEPKLTDIQTEEILDRTVIAHLLHKNPKAAAIWGSYRIIEALVSPLIQNGKALEILRRDDIDLNTIVIDDAYERPTENSGAWLVLFFLGLLLIAFVLYQILSREAHFTAKGWYLEYPWSKRHVKKGASALAEKNAKFFANREPHSPIVEAIRLAEKSSSGRIRVHISKRWMEKDPTRRAQQIFVQHKMTENPLRNSILLYVNLRKRKFAILGDVGINRVVELHYWQEMELTLSENLFSTQSERAIAFTVTSLGQALKKYFPSALA
ncbi:MAG: TPM domain-containing protein [Bdellovibrionia bacterium]